MQKNSSNPAELRREQVHILDRTFTVEFTLYKDEQVHLKEIYDGDRNVGAYMSREAKDEIEAYLMHHFTNHVA